MTCKINLIVDTKVVDLNISCIHSHNHEEKVDKISSSAHYQKCPQKTINILLKSMVFLAIILYKWIVIKMCAVNGTLHIRKNTLGFLFIHDICKHQQELMAQTSFNMLMKKLITCT